MHRKHYILFCFTITLILSGFAFGQSVLRIVPFDGTPATELMAQIKADTAANHGILPDRVYQLDGGGLYICQETFNAVDPHTLRLVSSNSEKSIIYLYPTGTGSNPQNPPGDFIRLKGGES